MVMTAVRLCFSNTWNGVMMLALDEQEVRLYWCVCVLEFEAVIGVGNSIYEVVISP